MNRPNAGFSRRSANAAPEEFFVSATDFQRRCVSHFNADRTSDLPADIAQQRSFGSCRDSSRPALCIQQVLRNLRLCRFAAPRTCLSDNYRLA
jgi:hypothetical protein